MTPQFQKENSLGASNSARQHETNFRPNDIGKIIDSAMSPEAVGAAVKALSVGKKIPST